MFLLYYRTRVYQRYSLLCLGSKTGGYISKDLDRTRARISISKT